MNNKAISPLLFVAMFVLSFRYHAIAETALPDDTIALQFLINKSSSFTLKPKGSRRHHIFEESSSDATESIQSMIDSVSSFVPRFGIFYWRDPINQEGPRADNSAYVELEPNRIYYITDTIVVPPNTFINMRNSTIVQLGEGKDIFKFTFEPGNRYFSSSGNGLVNGRLNCAGHGKRGLLLDNVDTSHFSNLRISQCEFGITAWNVQYTTFQNIHVRGASKAALYLTAPPGSPGHVTIDNGFIDCSFDHGEKYGIWMQAATHNRFFNTDVSRNLNTDIYFGADDDGDWIGDGHLQANAFMMTKIEHNRDDVPSSGFAININSSQARGSLFYDLDVERQDSGNPANQRYFKWLRNRANGTKVVMAISDSLDIEEPGTGSKAIWEVYSYKGLEVHYSNWVPDTVNLLKLAVDEDGNVVSGGDTRYIAIQRGARVLP